MQFKVLSEFIGLRTTKAMRVKLARLTDFAGGESALIRLAVWEFLEKFEGPDMAAELRAQLRGLDARDIAAYLEDKKAP